MISHEAPCVKLKIKNKRFLNLKKDKSILGKLQRQKPRHSQSHPRQDKKERKDNKRVWVPWNLVTEKKFKSKYEKLEVSPQTTKLMQNQQKLQWVGSFI